MKRIDLAIIALLFFSSIGIVSGAQSYYIDPTQDLWLRDNLDGSTHTYDVYKTPGYAADGNAVMWTYDNFSANKLNLSKWTPFKMGSDNVTLAVRNENLVLAGAGINSSANVVLNKHFINGVEIAFNETLTKGTVDVGKYSDVSVGSGNITGGKSGKEWWHVSFATGGSFRSQGVNRSVNWYGVNASNVTDVIPSPGISLSDYSNGTSPHLVAYGYDKTGRAYANALGLDQIRLPISVPDPYGFNQYVHPDELYDAKGVFGHTHWQFVTPFAWSDDRLENACLYYSDDGINYFVPPGVKNPIGSPTASSSASAYGSDPEIDYNPNTGKIMLYYVIGDVIGNTTLEIPKVRIYDGRDISPSMNMTFEDSESSLYVSPSIVYDKESKQFYLWIVDIKPVHHVIYRFTSKDGIHFVNKKLVKQSHWLDIWHIDMIKRPGDNKLYALFTFSGSDDLFIGVADNLAGNFKVQQLRPLLRSSDSSTYTHHNIQLYRSTGVFSDDGSTLRLWVSAKDSKGVRNVFYTEATFVGGYWGVRDFKTPAATLMSVPYNQTLNTSKRWMISQGDYATDHGCIRSIDEIWGYRTGHDPVVSVRNMGSYYRVTVTPTDSQNVSNYQVRISGSSLGIGSQQDSLRIEKVQNAK